jgi:hypothetical protein
MGGQSHCPWELRVGDFLVLYEISGDEQRVIAIAVGQKSVVAAAQGTARFAGFSGGDETSAPKRQTVFWNRHRNGVYRKHAR